MYAVSTVLQLSFSHDASQNPYMVREKNFSHDASQNPYVVRKKNSEKFVLFRNIARHLPFDAKLSNF